MVKNYLPNWIATIELLLRRTLLRSVILFSLLLPHLIDYLAAIKSAYLKTN